MLRLGTPFTSGLKVSRLFQSSILKNRSLMIVASFLLTAGYVSFQAFGYHTGITGQTNKPNDNYGCTCHSQSTNTTAAFSTSATSFTTGTSYTFTLTVNNSSQAAAGCDIAVYSGSLTAGTGLQKIGSQLTHTGQKTLSGGSTSWTFTYTAPNSPVYDTLYAACNAVNNSGNEAGDQWNYATKFVINVQAPQSTKAITLSRSTVNIGSIRVGRSKSDTMKINSTSTAAITVNTALKTGSPFSISPTTSNRSISAGSSEVNTFTISPSARGTFTDSVIITSNVDNAGDQRKAVYVTGTGIAGVYAGVSSSPIDFGNLRAGATRRKAFIYQNNGDDTLFMNTASISGNAAFTIVNQANRLNLAPGEKDSIVVQFAPTTASTNPVTASLTLTTTDNQSIPTISITGTGVAPKISVQPATNIGGARVGFSTTGNLQISNTGTDTLHVSTATLTTGSPKFSIPSFSALSIAPGLKGTVSISYTPQTAQTDTGSVTITSDDASTPSLKVDIYAAGLMPKLVVNMTDTVDFGGVKVGTPTTRDIPIKNEGSDILQLNTFAIAGSTEFVVTSKPGTLDAGQTSFVTVKFTPTSAGDKTATLSFKSDDPNLATATLQLRGAGTNSALEITPSELDFGNVPVATSLTKTITLKNAGTASVKINVFKLGGDATFSLVDTAAHTLAAGQQADVIVKFTPTDAKNYTGTFQIFADDGAAARTIQLRGVGTKGLITLSPSFLDFGTIDSGKTSANMATVLKNTGTAPVKIMSATITGIEDFTLISFDPFVVPPHTLNAGDSIIATFQFAPMTKSGTIERQIVFTLEDASTLTLTLHGVSKGAVVIDPNAVRPSAQLNADLSIRMSPNPASSMTKAMLNVKNATTADVKLYDVAGHIVLDLGSRMVMPGVTSMDIPTAGLPNGDYFVRVATKSGVSESRVVVQR